VFQIFLRHGCLSLHTESSYRKIGLAFCSRKTVHWHSGVTPAIVLTLPVSFLDQSLGLFQNTFPVQHRAVLLQLATFAMHEDHNDS
jgi:hypothetical protein